MKTNPLKKEVTDFLAVIKYSNFSKAADKLGVKQPGLSKSIKRLEEELGVKLFMRGARDLKLTDAGVIFYQDTLEILKSWDKAIQRSKQLKSEIHGQFSLGTHSIIGKYILPKLLKDVFKQKSLELSINLTSSKEAVELVREMKLDLAIAVKPIQYPDLIIIPLWKEFIGLYSKDGQTKEHIIYNDEMINAHEYLGQFNDAKKTAISDYPTIYSITKRNANCMCFLPNPIAENEGKLKLIKKMTREINVCLVFRQDRLRTKGFNYLVKSIKEAI